MRTRRGLDRLITFLDAVVAIAITLLVLPLVELVAGEGRETDLSAVIYGHGRQFEAFLLSFAVIARLWWAHHRLGEQVGAYDGAFVLINLVWVLTVVFLAFATQVVAASPAGPLAVALYIGTIAASSTCLLLLTVLLRRRPGLRLEDVKTQDINLTAVLSITTLLVLALVLGAAVPAVNYWALLLLFLSGPIERLIRQRADRPSG
jgi:TMEM175 potassium channel family protein